ncbi:17939_t:CDS:1 [Acaulospora morrowiae]|uniref:Voltage-gated hydrogen channel 1 n=1 Tax=Acaulospora morrowiae TaxID=94023 RepID=A0A9N9BWB1_9GLOM|nr:17939_t:CDS:1 [Acaulospora morrowiae]
MGFSGLHSIQERLGKILASRQFHISVLLLLIVDFSCVLAILILIFFDPINFTHEEHYIVVILSDLAFVINTLFLIEILLDLLCFGIKYFFTGPGWAFHLFDAIIVIATFFFDVFLEGKVREVAGLLIALRLWRLVKVLTSIAVGVNEYDKQKLEDLEGEFKNFVLVIKDVAEEEHWDKEKKQRIFSGTEVERIVKNVN